MHVTDDDKEAEGLLAAINDLGKQIQDFTLSADKYFGLATTTIAAAVALAAAQKLPAALVALPYALGGILLYVMQVFTERAARMGMRRFLEECLQQHAPFWYARQGACLGEAVSQRRASVRVSVGLYAATYLSACIIAIVATRKIKGVPADLLTSLSGVAIASMTLALIVAVLELDKAEGVAYEYMKAAQPRIDRPMMSTEGSGESSAL
jgi:hypothetical protein